MELGLCFVLFVKALQKNKQNTNLIKNRKHEKFNFKNSRLTNCISGYNT